MIAQATIKPKEKRFKPLKVPQRPSGEEPLQSNQAKLPKLKNQAKVQQKEGAAIPSFQKKLNTKENTALELLEKGYPQTYVDYFYLAFNSLPNVIEHKNYYGQKLPAVEGEGQVSSQLLDLLKHAEEQLRSPETQRKAFQSYLHVAEEMLEQENFVAAAYFFKQVASRSKVSGEKLYMMTALLGLGKCYDHQKRTDEAVQILQNTLNSAMSEKGRKEEEVQEVVRKISHTLIGIYLKLADRADRYDQNTAKALEYYQRCLEVARKAKEEEQEGNICYKIGQLHYKSEDYKKSVQYQQKYLEIVKGAVSTTKGQEFSQKVDGSLKAKLMEGHASLAKCYLKLKEIVLAESHLFQYNTLARDNRLYNAEADSSYYLAKLYEQKMQLGKAIEYYRKYFQAAKLQRNEKDRKLVDRARVTYAIAKANDSIDKFIKLVANSDRNIAELLDWKNKRDHK